MWPFRNEQNLPGFSRDRKGIYTFTLTDEEQTEINKQFDLFKDFYVHPSAAERLRKGVMARGLTYYAQHQIMISGFEKQESDKKLLIEKAMAAALKAYSLYPLPIYLYDLASFTEMARDVTAAKEAFKKYLNAQSSFKPDQIDKIFLQERDVDEAIKDAKSKIE